MKKYDRRKYTLPMQIKISDEVLFWQKPYFETDETLIEKLPEWLNNFKVNMQTIGFKKTIEDLPRIKGSALIIDHQMTASIEPHLETLRKYKGTLIVTDRTLWKVVPYRTPDIVANIDSSYLCISFFDRMDIRKHMKDINAVFAATTHPLTIRAWHGRRYFFMPWIGDANITFSLANKGNLPVMFTGGEVSTFIWILALNLGANSIGMLGIDNCYEDISQTEYPEVEHEKLEFNPWSNKKLPKPIYIDPVYMIYATVHHELIKYAKKKHNVETINCSPTGVMHSKWIRDMNFEKFIEEYS